jgi:hypothetical protein
MPKVKSIKPPPWSVEEMAASLHLQDGDGQKLAYVYFEEEPGAAISGQAADPRRGAADRGEHREAAAELLRKPD